MPQVSIMMITYNRPEYIREAAASVLAQSFTDWELIAVDDGSTDPEVLRILNESAAADARIRVYSFAHEDIPRARARALSYATGEFLAVLDSDDVWADKDKLKKQVAFLSGHSDCAAVGAGVVVIDQSGREKKRYQNPVTDENIRKMILSKNPLAHSSVLFRLRDVKAVGGYDENLRVGEDYDLYLRLGKKNKLANLPDYLIKYRIHDDNRTGREIRLALKNNLRIIRCYKNDYPGYCRGYLRRFFRLAVFSVFSFI